MHATTACRQVLQIVIVAALFIVLPKVATSAPLRWVDAPSSFIVVREDAPGDLHAFIRAMKKAGGHVAIVYPPRAAVVFADQKVLAAPALDGWIASAHRDRIEASITLSAEPVLQRAAKVWNASIEIGEVSEEAALGLPRSPDAGPRPFALEPAPPKLMTSDNLPYGAQYYDQSEYFAGTVAVAVWLLEGPASGSVHWDASEENWSIAGVQAGLGAWVRKGGDGAFLTFFIEPHTQVPVSQTPIEYSMGYDDVWINEVLGNLGWSGTNGFQKCYAFNDALRDSFDTNWAYSIFIADSNPSVNQGLFSGGGYAWAYYGGPWTYMSRYSTWAYNSSRYAAVVPMHEAGHIFHCTDEYDGSQQWLGYLNAPDNPASNPQCIMNRNDSTVVCQSTRNQLAWRDLDGDDIIEPHDTEPETYLVPSGPGPHSPMPTVTGSATITTLPNQNPGSNYHPPHDITVITVAAVECRVDGGPWSAATSTDGVFDGYAETFSWTAPVALGDGMHVVEARTQSSVGNWTLSYPSDTIEVNTLLAVGPPPGSGFALMAPRPNPAPGGVEIPFTLATATRVRAEVLDLGGRRVADIADGVWSAGTNALHWDGRDAVGVAVATGIYWVRVSAADQNRTVRVSIAR